MSEKIILALALIVAGYFELLSVLACAKADPPAVSGFLRSCFNVIVIWLAAMYVLKVF